MEYMSAIIAAIGAIITAWFAYNQKTKDKMTDLKIEKIRKDNEEKKKRRSDNTAIVMYEIWEALHKLKATRVYIVQPHPLGHESMLGIYFEAKRKGIESMKPHVNGLKMSDVTVFCSEMVKNLFVFYDDIDCQVKDRFAKSILAACGTRKVAIKRLSDNTHDWVGSIFCEYNYNTPVTEEEIRDVLHDVATSIQYILPEYQD